MPDKIRCQEESQGKRHECRLARGQMKSGQLYAEREWMAHRSYSLRRSLYSSIR